MNLSNLKPNAGSTHHDKRIGRGQGSGRGGTSTRGHKGAQSRSGYSRKLGFEGGQMPLQRRLPKFGFTNKERVEYKPINLSGFERQSCQDSRQRHGFESADRIRARFFEECSRCNRGSAGQGNKTLIF